MRRGLLGASLPGLLGASLPGLLDASLPGLLDASHSWGAGLRGQVGKADRRWMDASRARADRAWLPRADRAWLPRVVGLEMPGDEPRGDGLRGDAGRALRV
jgi:hypothetical protein